MTTYLNKTMRILNITLPAIVAMVFLLPRAALCEEYDMTDVNTKVKAITDKNLHVMEASYEPEQLLGSPEYQALRAKCTTDWEQIATNIDKVQGGDEAKKLVIYAFENLSPQNYMTAVERVVAKYQEGMVSDAVIRALHLPMGRMRAFLIDNYNHSRVTAALNKIRTKTKDSQLKASLGETLDGSDKADYERDRVELAGTPEGDIPKVILPP